MRTLTRSTSRAILVLKSQTNCVLRQQRYRGPASRELRGVPVALTREALTREALTREALTREALTREEGDVPEMPDPPDGCRRVTEMNGNEVVITLPGRKGAADTEKESSQPGMRPEDLELLPGPLRGVLKFVGILGSPTGVVAVKSSRH